MPVSEHEHGGGTPVTGAAGAGPQSGAGDIPALFERLGAGVAGAATVERVFGAPIQAQGRTVIPVARVGFGFGAGSGRNREGPGGGGGGTGVAPLGVIEIGMSGARFVPITSAKWLLAAAAAGLLIGRWLGARRARLSFRSR